jgi:hypothetical protein
VTWTCEWCNDLFSRPGSKPWRFCSRAHADEWLRRDKPSADQLRQWYVIDELSCVDIGLMVKRNPKRVWEWIREAGIETRGRGTDPMQHFKRGEPSAFLGKRHTVETVARLTELRREIPRERYAGNGQYLKDRSGPLHPNWKGGTTPERQAFYSTPEWKALARAVWIRDGNECRSCGMQPPRNGPKNNRGHVHHIQSFTVIETRSDIGNLILLCADCHRWVHSNANVSKEYIR